MLRKRRWFVGIALLLCFAVVACASPAAAPTPAPAKEAYGGVAPASPGAGESERNVSEGDTGKGDVERMIVRTAQLSLLVKDSEVSLGQIKAIVQELKGYVVDTSMWRQEDQLRGTVTVRVPAETLDEALSRFKALAVKVESERGSSQDVTEEYSDLGAQLRNLEATEAELLELLKTVRERTGKAEEILAVHRELTSIRGQIEQLKGRMQYLERTAAMSAVTIELIPDVLAKPISGGGWRPGESVAAALRALLNTLRFLVEAGIWLAIYVLPVLVVLAIPVIVIWYLVRRRRKAKS